MFSSRWWSNATKTGSSPTKGNTADSPKGEKSPSSSQASVTLKEELARNDDRFSADRLRTLYALLTNEPAVNDSNSAEIVAVLRNMSEILIWGDKNDPSVFECFLEKHMLANFVSILQQCGIVFAKFSDKEESAKAARDQAPSLTLEKLVSGGSKSAKRESSVSEVFSITAAHHVCTQVLQLLHILFENISQDTSLYFLLSNNFINQIIECVFDLSDDEILAHYVSLMKILSAKLNPHTIHFFHHENLVPKIQDEDPDFPLFTKALGLFSYPETMVRIAARTVILNIFNVRSLQSAEHSFINSPRLPSQLMRSLLDIMVKQAVKIRESLIHGELADGFSDAGSYGQVALDEDLSLVKQRIIGEWTERRKQGVVLRDLIVEHMEYVQYISDLAGLQVQPLNERVRTDYAECYVLPFVSIPLRNNFDALRRTDNLQIRRKLVVEILFSLVLLNFIASNLTDISLLFVSSKHAEDLLESLLHYLTVFDNQEAVPQDDRFPVLVLVFFLTLTERMTELKAGGLDMGGFFFSKLLPAVFAIIHRIPVVGFSECRVVVLRLACLWIEANLIGQTLFTVDDHFLAVLLDAREQACLSLRRFYKNDDAFIGLVELEVHIQHQLSKSKQKMERLLDVDLTSLLALCPRRATWANVVSKEGSRPSSAKALPAEERGFPDLCKRWPLTMEEKCRYYLRIFFLLRRLSNKLQKVSSPPLDKVTEELALLDGRAVNNSALVDEMPAPFQSVQIGDVVDISSCDTILSCTVIPFHTHLVTRIQDRLSTQTAVGVHIKRPSQLLLCPSDEEKWVKRFLIIHQWQMLFVEPDNRKLGFAVVKESFVLSAVQLLHEKEQRERIICCCGLATTTNHRTHEVNVSVGIETKTTLKSIFLQVQQQLPQRLAVAPNDAPWNLDVRYEAYVRVTFDDSIRAMAASTRIKKNQERIRELKLNAINVLLDLPIGTAHLSEVVDGIGNDAASGAWASPSMSTGKTERSKTVVTRHLPLAPSSQLLSVDSQKPRVKSGSRGGSRERPKSSRSTSGTSSIALTRLDTAGRSGFIERVEPDE